MDQGNNGLSRGDRNRNARLAALRVVVPRDHAVLGIDLAQSRQAAVLADHDSRVLARWRPRCSPWMLGELLDRALRKALAAGFAGITVACEPTGHRWMVISQLAGARGMPMVCVQPLVVARSREAEDCTRGKNDDRDAVLIARLAAQLHCYLPGQADQDWARLRHLGARRSRLVEASTMCVQQLRDLLEVAWPAVLQAAADPLESATWLACLSAALGRGDGDLGAVHAMGQDAFIAAARGGLDAWGVRRICRRIAVAAYAALADGTGVRAQRLGAAAGLSGNALARRMGVVQSRVWKIEHGDLMPGEDDIKAWAAASGRDDTTGDLLEMLADARTEQAFGVEFRRKGGPEAYQDRVRTVEEAATRIGEFQVAVIPGILQTAEYARALMTMPAGLRSWGADDAAIEASVDGRLRRQEIIHRPGKRIQVMLGEGALRTLVAPPDVLAGQLGKLLSVAQLPSVELGVIGFGQQMPVFPLGFRVYDNDLIVVESIVQEKYFTADENPGEMAAFLEAFNELRQAASTGADAEAIIQRALDSLR